MSNNQKLKLWTVYNSPIDFQGQFVAREFIVDKPTANHFAHTDIEKVHQWIFQQASLAGQGQPYCLPREASDDPRIVHTWV